MEKDKDIIANHQKMMNDNYHYEGNDTSKNNILKPYYIFPMNNPSMTKIIIFISKKNL